MWFLRKKKPQALESRNEQSVAVATSHGLIKQTAEERIECKIAAVREERRQAALIESADNFCGTFLEMVYAVFEFDVHKLNGFDGEELFVLANLLRSWQRVDDERNKRPWIKQNVNNIHDRYADRLDKMRRISGSGTYFPLEQLRNKIQSWIEKPQNKQEEVKNG